MPYKPARNYHDRQLKVAISHGTLPTLRVLQAYHACLDNMPPVDAYSLQ
jgi:hypothetical protein